jgi:hypothetical protein
VVIRGLVPSYHVKQLAVLAILEVLAVAKHVLAAEVRISVEAPGASPGGYWVQPGERTLEQPDASNRV